MANVDLVILVDEKRRAELDKVAKALEDNGLHVQEKLPRFRTIIGSSDSLLMDKFKSVEGVEMVRTQCGFQLPPMDEKIPQ